MARAQANLEFDSAYLEYFGLTRPPFARLSNPSQVFDTEQYSLLTDQLARATEQPDHLLIICGADGSGKTTLLKRYIASLSEDVYFATIDETCNGAKNFQCNFLRQLGFGEIAGSLRELRSITKEFLVHRGMAGDSVLLIIDNANLIHPTVLEQLKWLAAIKVDEHRVFSVVLAGNSDLVRIMESPAMTQTQFRNTVRFNIRAYSEDEIAKYIWHRLSMASGSNAVKFSSSAYPLIYRFTGGIANLINMLCEALLVQAHAVKSRIITDELVRAVADEQRLLPHIIPLTGKGRRKTDPDFDLVISQQDAEEPVTADGSASKKAVPNKDVSNSHVDDLLSKVSLLSVELGELRADRKRNLQDIAARDADIVRLHEELSEKTAELGVLTDDISYNRREIEASTKALTINAKALQKGEKTVKKLATSLENEGKLAKQAQAELDLAEAKLVEHGRRESELLESVSRLEAEMAAADERSAAFDDLTNRSTDLEKDIENERKLAKHSQAELDLAEAKLVEHDRRESELLESVSRLEAEVAATGERSAEIDDLTNRSANLEKDIEYERQLAKQALAELELAETKLTDQSRRESELLESVSRLEEEMAAADEHSAEVDDLTNRSTDLERDIENERKLAKQAQAELELAETKLTEQGRRESELLESVSRLEAEMAAADERSAETNALENRTTDLEKYIENERQIAKQAQVELDLAEARLAEQSQRESELLELVSHLEVEIAATGERSAELLESVSRLEAEIAVADERSAAFDDLTNRSTDLEKDIENERQLAKQALAELDLAEAKLVEHSQRESELLESVSHLEAEMAAADERSAEVDDLTNRFTDLERDVENERQLAKQAQGELDLAHAKLVELSRRESELLESVSRLEAEMAAADERSAEIDKLTKKSTDLEKDVEEAQTELNTLRRELENRDEEIVALTATNTVLTSSESQHAVEEKNLALESDIQQIKRMLAEANAQITEDSKTIAILKADALCAPSTKDRATERKRKSGSAASEHDLSAAIVALEVVRAGKIEKSYAVSGFKPRMMIGRSEDSDICLDSRFVSRHHALILLTAQGISIEDLNSANGTIVNSDTTTHCDLRAGDIVYLGDFELRAK